MITLAAIQPVVKDALLAAIGALGVLVISDTGREHAVIEQALRQQGMVAVVTLPNAVLLQDQGRNLFVGRATFDVVLLSNPEVPTQPDPINVLSLVGTVWRAVAAIPIGPGEDDFQGSPEFMTLETEDPGLLVYRLSFQKQVSFPLS